MFCRSAIIPLFTVRYNIKTTHGPETYWGKIAFYLTFLRKLGSKMKIFCFWSDFPGEYTSSGQLVQATGALFSWCSKIIVDSWGLYYERTHFSVTSLNIVQFHFWFLGCFLENFLTISIFLNGCHPKGRRIVVGGNSLTIPSGV